MFVFDIRRKFREFDVLIFWLTGVYSQLRELVLMCWCFEWVFCFVGIVNLLRFGSVVLLYFDLFILVCFMFLWVFCDFGLFVYFIVFGWCCWVWYVFAILVVLIAFCEIFVVLVVASVTLIISCVLRFGGI